MHLFTFYWPSYISYCCNYYYYYESPFLDCTVVWVDSTFLFPVYVAFSFTSISSFIYSSVDVKLFMKSKMSSNLLSSFVSDCDEDVVKVLLSAPVCITWLFLFVFTLFFLSELLSILLLLSTHSWSFSNASKKN